MLEFEKVSAQIYGIYLKYVASEDVHVYSIDECFIDCTPYLHFYETAARRSGETPAHVMALTMIRDTSYRIIFKKRRYETKRVNVGHIPDFSKSGFHPAN